MRPELGYRAGSALNPSIRPLGECRAGADFHPLPELAALMERLGLGGATEPHDSHSDDSPLGKGQGPMPLAAPNSSTSAWDTVSRPCA